MRVETRGGPFALVVCPRVYHLKLPLGTFLSVKVEAETNTLFNKTKKLVGTMYRSQNIVIRYNVPTEHNRSMIGNFSLQYKIINRVFSHLKRICLQPIF